MGRNDGARAKREKKKRKKRLSTRKKHNQIKREDTGWLREEPGKGKRNGEDEISFEIEELPGPGKYKDTASSARLKTFLYWKLCGGGGVCMVLTDETRRRGAGKAGGQSLHDWA